MKTTLKILYITDSEKVASYALKLHNIDPEEAFDEKGMQIESYHIFVNSQKSIVPRKIQIPRSTDLIMLHLSLMSSTIKVLRRLKTRKVVCVVVDNYEDFLLCECVGDLSRKRLECCLMGVPEDAYLCFKQAIYPKLNVKFREEFLKTLKGRSFTSSFKQDTTHDVLRNRLIPHDAF